jgi:hypothetical protein
MVYDRNMRYNNGEGTIGHDDDKYRENFDDAVKLKNGQRPDYTGREVPKDQLPVGMRTRIVYGGKK